MTHRIKYKDQLSARVAGRYAVYRTSVKRARTVVFDCTCPSEVWPCKHARALVATWEVSPQSFLDLKSCLRALSGHPEGASARHYRPDTQITIGATDMRSSTPLL